MERDTLPCNMIFEILSRASLETLDRCKAVSKDWKKIIYEATFLSLYIKRRCCVFGYIFQDMRDNKYLSSLVMEEEGGGGDRGNWSFDDTKIVASCNQGILCCEKRINYKNYRYYACKPTTNQWQALPNPKLRYKTVVVAVVVRKSRRLCFTIVRLSKQEKGITYNCEVFDSETWAWEKTKPPILTEGDFINYDETSVSIGEFIYWLTSECNVLAFDINKRRFRCFQLPDEVVVSGYKFTRLGEYEGGLALTRTHEEEKTMELWVLAHNESWTRKMTVDMTVPEEILSYHRPVEFCNSDVVFLTTDDGAALYNVENSSFSRINVPFHLRSARQIFRFRSDFEKVSFKPCP